MIKENLGMFTKRHLRSELSIARERVAELEKFAEEFAAENAASSSPIIARMEKAEARVARQSETIQQRQDSWHEMRDKLEKAEVELITRGRDMCNAQDEALSQKRRANALVISLRDVGETLRANQHRRDCYFSNLEARTVTELICIGCSSLKGRTCPESCWLSSLLSRLQEPML